MGRNAVEEDIVLGGGQRAMASRDHHRRIVVGLIGNVGADEIIHAVQMAVLHDGFRTANAFLRWLEDQLHGPVKGILNGHQHLRHAQADGGMAVMAAGMHKALVDGAEALAGRPVGFVLFLKYAQCVDVETHGYCGALSAAQDTDHSGHTALCIFHKLRICPLGHSSLVLLLQLLIRRNAHSGIFFADLVAH